MSGTNDKKTSKVPPQAAIAQGVKNKPPGNKVDTRRQRQGSGQGLGSRVKSKQDKKVSKQDDVKFSEEVEDFIDALGGSDGARLNQEFKEILRKFNIKSMADLGKRLEFENSSQKTSGVQSKEANGTAAKNTTKVKQELRTDGDSQALQAKRKGTLKDLNERKKKDGSHTPEKDEEQKSSLRDNNDENDRTRSSSAQKEMEKLNSELHKLKSEKEKAEADVKELNIKLEAALNEKDLAEIQAQKEIQDLKSKSEEATSENDRTRSSSAQKEREKLNSELGKLKSEKKKAEAEVQELNSKLKEALHEKVQAQKEIQDLKSKSEEATKEMNKYLQPDTKKLKDEIDQLKNRLSQLAGSKLTEGNPAIADLSDMNRPINLGEKFSELYDNQWTDAFEELSEKEKKDEEVISELLKTVTKAYEFCTKQSEDFHHKLKDLMKQFSMDPKKLPTEVSKQMKDYRKGLAVSLLQDVQEGFCKKQKNIKESQVKMYAYARRCIAVCWFMTVQDPPVFMDANPGNSVFDNDKFRAYTKTGKQIDYLVWPALYLHAEGPLLSKGVAQGK